MYKQAYSTSVDTVHTDTSRYSTVVARSYAVKDIPMSPMWVIQYFTQW